VRARAEGGNMVLEVQDDGRGPDAPRGARRHRASGNGVALANIRQRLQARYGNAASLELEPAAPGTLARMRLPLPPRPAA
jgi:LytS/YehU family sensor histidine kinase